MLPIVLIFIFATAMSLFLAVHLLFFEKKRSVRERLSENGKLLQEPNFTENNRKSRFWWGILQSTIEYIEKLNYYTKIKMKLLQAYIKMKPIEFIEISLIAGMFFGTLLYQVLNNGLMAIVGFLLGYRLPETVIEMIRKKRAKQFNDQLPQALGLLANGMRAGFSFPQAMAVVGREMEAPVADEFLKVLRDNSYGKNMDEALTDLSKRIDDEDLDMFVTTLLIQMQVGGDLAEILDIISETIRERVKLKGDIRTLTAQSQMSAWVIGVLPAALAAALFMISREYIMVLFTEPLGLMLVGAAALMMIVGIIALVKIVQVKI